MSRSQSARNSSAPTAEDLSLSSISKTARISLVRAPERSVRTREWNWRSVMCPVSLASIMAKAASSARRSALFSSMIALPWKLRSAPR
eukprot:scaffold24990_cov63-Phaeocystis_antarctica.AAC.7